MVAAEAHKKILFNNKPPSLEIKYMFFLFSILSNLIAYKSNDPAVIKTRKTQNKYSSCWI